MLFQSFIISGGEVGNFGGSLQFISPKNNFRILGKKCVYVICVGYSQKLMAEELLNRIP